MDNNYENKLKNKNFYWKGKKMIKDELINNNEE